MKSVEQAKPVEGPSGITRRTLAYCREAMLCHFRLKQGAEIPLHGHRATQIGYVISGKVRFIGEQPDRQFEVQAGDSYAFDAEVKHGAVVLEDSEFVEVFTPPREEYKDF